MCLGIPMKVVSVDGYVAECTAAYRTETVDLALTGPVAPGSWVLVFLGAAREILAPETADQITRALSGLQAAMAGRDTTGAFADLEAHEPQLPAHLEAARRKGASTA